MRPSPAPASARGIASCQPESALGTIGTRITSAADRSTNPARTIVLARRLPARRPRKDRGREHRQRQRRERDPRLECAVAEDQLQVDRERDQHPAQRDLLEEDLRHPGGEER
jgi:hypothetical protein